MFLKTKLLIDHVIYSSLRACANRPTHETLITTDFLLFYFSQGDGLLSIFTLPGLIILNKLHPYIKELKE